MVSFSSLALQKDGKIVAAGSFSQGLNVYSALIRFGPDGRRDSSFGVDGKVVDKKGKDDEIDAMIVENGGDILTAITRVDSTGGSSYLLARFLPNGNPDSTYMDGEAPLLFPSNLIGAQSDEKIITAGPYFPVFGNFELTRYTPEGSVDQTFGYQGTMLTGIQAGFEMSGTGGRLIRASKDNITSLAMDDAGKIVLSGYSELDNNSDGYSIFSNSYNNRYHSAIFFLARYTDSSPTSVRSKDNQSVEPAGFRLMQNYPNPFNPKTIITTQLPTPSHVTLAVYNMLGQEVAVLVDENRVAGRYRDSFDGSGLASGVYICRLTAGRFIQSMKMLLLK